MATTMKLIAKNVLGSDTATVTFSSIPGTFDDLYLVFSARTDRASGTDVVKARINGAGSDTDHSVRWLRGSGSAASSSSLSYLGVGSATGNDATASTFSSSECLFPNYSGTSANKSASATGVDENNNATAYIYAFAGLWASTSAITAIELIPNIGTVFKSDSSFYLYGIKKA
jgi:hypothetical protein